MEKQVDRIGAMDHATPSVTSELQRRRRQFRIRTMMLAVAVVAVCLWVALDPFIGPLALSVLVWVAGTMALMAATMGLGLLGFGLCTAGERMIGWLRRAASWPDD